MIPLAPEALQMLSQRMLVQLVPDAKSAYSMSDGMLLGVLLGSLVNEMAEGIERRLADIGEMKALFEQASDALAASRLPVGMDEVLGAQPASMTMADVNAVHDAHTRVLIDLHASVDTAAPGDPADTINLAIWAYLDSHARRHALNV